MLFNLLILTIATFTTTRSENEEKVSFYENLITTEINKAYQYQPPTSSEEFKPTDNSSVEDYGVWDFIVVGAGCGGSIIANRLSEIKKWKILLIEAGGGETNFSVIPRINPYLRASKLNWGFVSTTQENACLGMKNNRCQIPRGKVLGGSTSINGMFYSRGNKEDYNYWVDQGNPGWSYKEVLPYFIKSENSQINGDAGYHGTGGYWNVKYVNPINEQFIKFIEGSKIFQNFNGTDYNGKNELGSYRSQFNQDKQYRQSTNKAFLEPISNRSNLKILTGAYVIKLLKCKLSKNIKSVLFVTNGKQYQAKIRKEVILSAGAIKTPQILMLSGIGPSEHLRQLNVPVIRDLPVGKTFFDHPLFYGTYIGTNVTIANLTLREQVVQFLHGYGPLTKPINTEVLGFFQTKSEINSASPDIEFLVSLVVSGIKPVALSLLLKDEVYNTISNSLHFNSVLNPLMSLIKPQSVGLLTLKSNDPYQFPIINPKYLTEQNDKEAMYRGIEIIKKLINTKPMREINATLVLVDYPQCKNNTLGSKDYWFCVFKLLTATTHHASGTCRMGFDTTTSVVDSTGLVHGLRKLRVVDASILPSIIAGHTAAPTAMIAEKIADLIKLKNGYHIEKITNVIS